MINIQVLCILSVVNSVTVAAISTTNTFSLSLMTLMLVLFCMCPEGLANPGEAFTVFYGERNPWCEY